MIYTPITKKAIKLCFEAHKEQVDKSGMPYVFHPFHLAEQMQTEETTVVALLHDLVEDTDYTIEDLVSMGFSKNITDAIAFGLISESLTAKLNELEIQKMSLEQQLRDFKDTVTITDIDPSVILSDYAELKRKSDTTEYKTFICNFIDRIEIGRYTVNIRLKTGLDIFPALDNTYSVRREEIYKQGKALA